MRIFKRHKDCKVENNINDKPSISENNTRAMDNICVKSVMSEYDLKTDLYGKGVLPQIQKGHEKVSTFSNLDDLKAIKKRIDCTPKIGEQRNIVDFLGFYSAANQEEVESKAKKLVK